MSSGKLLPTFRTSELSLSSWPGSRIRASVQGRGHFTCQCHQKGYNVERPKDLLRQMEFLVMFWLC